MLSVRLDEYLRMHPRRMEAALTAFQCSASRDPESMAGEGRDDACAGEALVEITGTMETRPESR